VPVIDGRDPFPRFDTAIDAYTKAASLDPENPQLKANKSNPMMLML